MARAFADITFTPSVKAAQSLYGSREFNTRFELDSKPFNTLSERESDFVRARDSFYMASVSENGWPYVQHRGGAQGFLKVLDEHTIGFADYSGNRQYLSVGNINNDDRVSLILMDYSKRRRLKLWGRSRVVNKDIEPEIIDQLSDADYRARVERGIVIQIEAIEWNCPQHITERFTKLQIEELVMPVINENKVLKDELAQLMLQIQS